MAKKVPWWKKVLMAIRVVSKEVEDGNIGAGKKTSQGGKVAGAVIDAALEATSDEEEETE